MPAPLLIAKSTEELLLLPGLANRHGLIAGATGTGKTVTLQRIAEEFSKIGVPVFMADVKGDLQGGSTGPRGGRREGMVEMAANSAACAIGSQVGRKIIHGVLGSLFGGKRRR